MAKLIIIIVMLDGLIDFIEKFLVNLIMIPVNIIINNLKNPSKKDPTVHNVMNEIIL